MRQILNILAQTILDVESALQSSPVPAVGGDDASNANKPPTEIIKQGMVGKSESGLHSQVAPLNKMAEGTGPTLDALREILVGHSEPVTPVQIRAP